MRTAPSSAIRELSSRIVLTSCPRDASSLVSASVTHPPRHLGDRGCEPSGFANHLPSPRPCPDIAPSRIRNTVLPTRYRHSSRRGSESSRNNHSTPSRLIHRGARRLRPERKSNAAPTHTIGLPTSVRQRTAHASCFGADTANQRTSASDSRTCSTRWRFCSRVHVPNGGVAVPTILIPAYRSCKTLVSSSTTPSSPPRRKNRVPSAAARSVARSNRSGPGHRPMRRAPRWQRRVSATLRRLVEQPRRRTAQWRTQSGA